MKRILIVDDEKPIRDWIASVCSECLPQTEYEVITAKNGKAALERYREKPAEIIFTDIRMPVMDGLELAKAIRAEDEPAYIAVLTNFSDFEYARQAFMNKADAYLLKTELSEDSLGRLLETALDTLRKRQAEQQGNIRVESVPALLKEWQNAMEEGREPDFCKKYNITLTECPGFFLGLLPMESLAEPLKIPDLPDNRVLFSLECDNALLMGVSIETANSRLLQYQMIFRYIQTLMNRNPGYFCSYSDIMQIRRNPGRICGALQDVLDGLNMRYYTADRAFQVTEVSLARQKQSDTMVTEKYLATINAFNLEDLNAFQQAVGDFFDCLKQNPVLNMEYLVLLCDKICEKIIYKFYDRKSGDYSSVMQEAHSRLKHAKSLNELRAVVEGRIRLFRDRFVDSGYSAAVKKSLEYIHSQYRSIGSIGEIAGQVGLNPDYLSRIFKQETGHNLSNYLNNFRLKQAVLLLMNSDKKVYEIADEVGFSDSAYFSKKFREVYGISPNSYKSGSGS